MRAALVALAAFEVAVGGRGATLLRLQLVGVHAQTHRTSGLAPLEASRRKDLIQALGLGFKSFF